MKKKFKLNDLRAPYGANKRRKILGRGIGSGHGGTSTKGHKGEKARSGGNIKPGFEGGQMSLLRRLPKFGFNPLSRIKWQLVNVESLNIFKDNENVTPELLKNKGLIKNPKNMIKVLGDGELKRSLTVQADCFSNSAIEKITKAGGKAVDKSGKEVSKKIKVKKVAAPKVNIAKPIKPAPEKTKEKQEKKDKSKPDVDKRSSTPPSKGK